MKPQIIIVSLLAVCLPQWLTWPKVTFLSVVLRRPGWVAKDVGPNRFEAELHKSAKFTAKGKVERAIEF